MKCVQLIATVLAAAILHAANGSNILAVFPHTGKSHFFMFEPLISRLAERGHAITLVSHYPPANASAPNVNYIRLPSAELLFNSLNLKENDFLRSYSKLRALQLLNHWGQQACESVLTHPPIRKLIESKPRFDLVMIEYFNSDCLSVLSHVFDAPLVAIFSSLMMPWHYDRFGNPDNPSYIVSHFLDYSSEMNLGQRTMNAITTFGVKLYYRIFFNWPTDAIIRKHLGPGIPPVAEMVKKTSVFFVNSHFSLFQARPLVPGIIEVGGLHVVPGKKLPQHLETYLENSPNGAIVVSLGSTVLGHTLPEDKSRAMTRALSKVSANVIWKWENETMLDKPKNVLLQKWIPQNDVLAHPKVKLFVTHSGLMSTQEAVYHGVPMLMIPLFGDQPINAASCLEKGLGIVLDYHSIDEETFHAALVSMLENRSYAETARYVSRTFRDRPVPIVDYAVYWTEYVIRFRGAPHLRSSAVHLPWYSEYLLDVLLVVGCTVFAVAYAATYAVKKCLGSVATSRTTSKSKRE